MDTFIDRLAQKKNAQEMIRANSAAEAAKMDQLQKQLQAYDELMQEIRRVNIKTAENVESMRVLLAQYMTMLKGFKMEDRKNENMEEQLATVKSLLEEEIASVKALLDERLAQTEGIVHKENVKVYRNVQAAFTEEMEKKNQQEQQSQQGQGKSMPARLGVVILIAVIADIVVNLIPLMM